MIKIILFFLVFSINIFAFEEFANSDECREFPAEIPSSIKQELKNFFFTPSMYFAAQDIIIGLQKVLKEENEQKRNELYAKFYSQAQCLKDLDKNQKKAFEKVFDKKLIDHFFDREQRFDNYVHYYAQFIYVNKIVNKKYKFKIDYSKAYPCESAFYQRLNECGNQIGLDIKAMEKFKNEISYNASNIDTGKFIKRFKLLNNQDKNFKALFKHIDQVIKNKPFKKNEQSYILVNVYSCFDSIAQRNQFILEQKAIYIENHGGRVHFLRTLANELYLNNNAKGSEYHKNLAQKKQFRTNPYDSIDPNNPYCSFPFDNKNIFRR